MNVLRVITLILAIATTLTVCPEALGQSPPTTNRDFILVIDAGHGGSDPGAINGRLREKDLNLEIALALGARIAKEIPGVNVLYTRTDDRAIGLAARGDFANRAGADLFLSIHTNSFRNPDSRGSETYVMGMDKSEANLAVAKLENEVIKYEEDYTETYAGFDPESTELSIVFGMLQYANFESSLSFARIIQRHYTANTPLRDRGAKQGPFAVLWKPTMPRVLVEMGYISNETDRRYIFSTAGKQTIVRSLFDAFREYHTIARGDSDELLTQQPQPATQQPTTTPTTPQRAEPRIETRIDFWVQLAAAGTRVSTRDAMWGAHRGKVTERHADGWYKYSLGPYPTRRAAERALEEVRRGKFSGAFIVETERNSK